MLVRLKGDLDLLGTGRGRVEVGGVSTLIEGTEGVTEMDGVLLLPDPLGDGLGDSLTDIVGIEGALTLEPL